MTHPSLRNSALAVAIALLAAAPACARDDDGWVQLFDGKTLDGWESWDKSGVADVSKNWKVVDGVIHGEGDVAHLFSPRGDYKNFHYRAEISVSDGGNSGMYFRTKKGPGYPDGYEAQVNSTHRDPVKTGSLYNRVLIKRILVPPDTWFTQEVIARGNRITVIVNGEELYEFVDNQNAYSAGYFAFQQHDPGSKVKIRKVEVKELP